MWAPLGVLSISAVRMDTHGAAKAVPHIQPPPKWLMLCRFDGFHPLNAIRQGLCKIAFSHTLIHSFVFKCL